MEKMTFTAFNRFAGRARIASKGEQVYSDLRLASGTQARKGSIAPLVSFSLPLHIPSSALTRNHSACSFFSIPYASTAQHQNSKMSSA